jgi:cytoskeletal protein CcmA (bactofilin family)
MFTKKPEREGDDPLQRMSERKAPNAEGNASLTERVSSYVKSSTKSVPSIIGEDLTITGNVVSKGEIQVDGEIQGDVQCSSLLLGDKSQVVGGVIAEDVVVRGRVVGSIRALRVTLQAQSHVEGDIFHHSLAIEQGAFFEGKSRRSDDPLSNKQTPGNPTPAPKPSSGMERADKTPDQSASGRLAERLGEPRQDPSKPQPRAAE